VFKSTLRTGKPYFSSDFSAKRNDLGVVESYEWQIQRVTLPAGQYGLVCFFNNITERKRAEASKRRIELLSASNRKLEREIAHRRTVERRLKRSELHQRSLLEGSRAMQQQMRSLSHQVLQTQEEERKQISRELHDQISQVLVGINIQLETLKRKADQKRDGLGGEIDRTQRLVQKSVEIVHQFARELRPAMLDDLGLIPALHSFMKAFSARTGIRIELATFAQVESLAIGPRTVLFRVAQEALTNVARHARASRVKVSIQKLRQGVCMKIADDGRSFELLKVMNARGGKHLGLLGMRERLEMVGGALEVIASPGKGTLVKALLPLGEAGVQKPG
jgi:signal transduction histidine kinase